MTIKRTQYGDDGGGNPAAPSEDAVFVSDVVKWVRAEGYTGEEDVLKPLIDAAFEVLDGSTGMTSRTLIDSKYLMTLDCFPHSFIEIPLPPVAAIDSLTYRDSNGDTQTLVEDMDYRVNRLGALNSRARIIPLKSWPSVDRYGDAVAVAFSAGQGAKPSVMPKHVQDVVKTIVAHRYRFREEGDVMPSGVSFEGLLNAISFVGNI